MAEEEKYFLNPTAEEINDVLNRATTKPEGVQDGNIPLFSSGRDLVNSGRNRDSYALALKTTDGPAESIEIYPDEGSNIVVTAHGYTEQEGSGDPSPENVRPIKVGGIYMKEVKIVNADGIRQGVYGGNQIPYIQFTPNGIFGDKIISNKMRYVGRIYGSIGPGPWVAWSTSESGAGAFLSIPGDYKIVDYETQIEYFRKISTEENPLMIWYPVEKDVSDGVYTWVFLDGGDENVFGICVKIEDLLCGGDYVISFRDGKCVEHHDFAYLELDENDTYEYYSSSTETQTAITVKFGTQKMKSTAYGSPDDVCSIAKYVFSSTGGGFYFSKSTRTLVFGSSFCEKNGIKTPDDLKNLAITLKNEGKPISLVYKRYEPVEYVYSPIYINLKSGQVIIYSEKTASVTYNKSIAKALEELQSALTALKEGGA